MTKDTNERWHLKDFIQRWPVTITALLLVLLPVLMLFVVFLLEDVTKVTDTFSTHNSFTIEFYARDENQQNGFHISTSDMYSNERLPFPFQMEDINLSAETEYSVCSIYDFYTWNGFSKKRITQFSSEEKFDIHTIRTSCSETGYLVLPTPSFKAHFQKESNAGHPRISIVGVNASSSKTVQFSIPSRPISIYCEERHYIRRYTPTVNGLSPIQEINAKPFTTILRLILSELGNPQPFYPIS